MLAQRLATRAGLRCFATQSAVHLLAESFQMKHKIIIQLSVQHVGKEKIPRYRVAQILASKATELLIRSRDYSPNYVVTDAKIRRTLSPK